MKPSSPWELPAEVVHPATKHVVGRVYRDGPFIAFDRSGEAHYELDHHGTVMETSHGLHLRLSSESPSEGMASWGKLLDRAIFDECLCGDTAWSMDEPCFTRMRLPFPNIVQYLSLWPTKVRILKGGGMTIRTKRLKGFKFTLRGINAKGWLEFMWDWSSKTFVSQKITARAELVIEYAAPVPLSKIKEHEERLRAFFDYIWFRGHKTGLLYLHQAEKMAILYRRESLGPEERVVHAMSLPAFLAQKSLAKWIERWFSLSKAQHMAIEPMVSIARNQGTITDLKFVMATHATDALLRAQRETTAKDSDMAPRFFHHLGSWWKNRNPDLSDDALATYLDHLVWTRNEVLKAVRHPKASPETLLPPLERARAYFELLLLHRALFLEVMGVGREQIDSFVEQGFDRLRWQGFRYFKD